jgi:DNA-binding beta-propeller fold protein YncE
MSFRLLASLVALVLGLGASQASSLGATETENIGLRILPAPGPVVVDGASGDWDLSGGIFCCGDVENQRSQFGTWFHAMYDAENLYLLARFVDPTPLNNPGQVEGDYGFAGDCLQFRLIVGAGAGGSADQGRGSHWTCWRGRDGKHVMDVAYGVKFDKPGSMKDAQAKGAKQAFTVWADKQGYNQELAIPWSLIGPEGWKPAAGGDIRLTIEPNFTVGSGGRLTNKDIFAADMTIDRVFTFMSFPSWGTAHFEAKGAVAPSALRLSDRREFTVRMERGEPVIDWTGLIVQKEMPGHKAIAFDMPFDGYCSLNLFAADGSVARQLLNTAFFTKGTHEVKWDGLTTYNWRTPGDPVPPGTYTWQALVHPGLDLKLVGWADNSGAAPWDGPSGKDNWGGDEGLPTSAAVLGDKVLLGWSGAEAGKAMVCCDLAGAVQWKHSRQGMSGCLQVAADGHYVYGVTWAAENRSYAYRLDIASGSYAPWKSTGTPDLMLQALLTNEQKKTIPDRIDAIAAHDGKLYLASTTGNAVLVCDGESGALIRIIPVPAPVALAAGADGRLLVSSNHHGIQTLDPATGTCAPFAQAKKVWGLAVDGDGSVYAAVRGELQQVLVFDRTGTSRSAIGRAGGRAPLGKWDQGGLRNPHGIAVDRTGQLWVTEEDNSPKRISVWDAHGGAFKQEFFGPSSYGALGGIVCPSDPRIVIGQGCEWRIDAVSGKSSCLAVIHTEGMENSRFGTVTDKQGKEHLYLAVAAHWAFDNGPVWIYERLGEADWKLRSMLSYCDAAGKDLGRSGGGTKWDATTRTVLWADANGDGKRDDNEVTSVPGVMKFSGWYMGVTPDLSLYAEDRQFRVSGLTACGAPTWDLAKGTRMPAAGLGSADGRLVLAGGDYGASNSRMRCFDIASGRQLWWYPDNFVGVHGSHNAPPPEVGLIRGSFNACASVRLPEPIGNLWVIPTNVGEWHLVTERGFYLSRLFQSDQVKVRFPDKAVPGVGLNDVPCGMGGEDFGGSACVAKDGKLYLQAGKTGFWDVVVENLDKVQLIQGGSIVIAEADLVLAQKVREQVLQSNTGIQRLALKKAAPAFTGNLDRDFAGHKAITYEKGAGTRVRSAAAWDDAYLYLAWEVQDKTPWVNGARSPDALYWGGDTVDFQLACDPSAPAGREKAVKGDLRISIGNFNGKDTAVIFRPVADDKSHRTLFSSGVVKEYWMDCVQVLDQTRITVAKRGDGYTVEAAIRLGDLGLMPKAGLGLKGDFGATFGNQAGDRTRIRSFWSNQHTGLVDDVVFEAMLEPKHWGELTFTE